VRDWKTRARGWVLATAMLPALILACVVLLQGNELNVANGAEHCVGTAAKCVWLSLAQVSSERSTMLAYGWVGVAVMLTLGVGLAVLLTRLVATEPPRNEDRAVLVRACMDVSDAVPSAALREQLVDALAGVGVVPVEVATGERFDSSRHRAVGRVGTSDRACHDLVAKTERAGYVDRGKRLRYPEVLVFNADGGKRQ
jgi:hypothetical protein